MTNVVDRGTNVGDTVAASGPITRGRVPSTVPYRPAIDGLRALAVLAVIVYHMEPAWLPGGFFGVDMFFVISGYLITSLLVGEWARNGGISLKNFWFRRARRLLPALFTMIAVVVALASAVAPDAVSRLRADVPAAIGYVTNWRLIFHRDSYFQAIGRPPLLEHLWSLAIEEQFYLLWPPILLLLLRRRLRRHHLAIIALAGAAAASTAMALLYHSGQDPSRVYFGTDTRCEGLLIGVAVGLVAPPWRLSSAISVGARRVLAIADVVVLAGLGAAMLWIGETSAVAYRGGFVLVDVLAAFAVFVAAHPAEGRWHLLGRQPLLWAGTRSYALYLWHWPILMLTRPGADLALPSREVFVIRAAAIVVAAELSYRLVERPWRSGAVQGWLREARRGLRWPALGAAGAVVAGMSVLLAVASPPAPPPGLAALATPAAKAPIRAIARARHQQPTVSPVTATDTTAGVGLAGSRTSVGSQTTPSTGQVVGTNAPPRPPAVTTAVQNPATSTPASAPGSTAPTTMQAASYPQGSILAIGDSVLLAASPDLEQAFGPAITVDAQVGRQVDDGIARLQAYRAAGRLAGLQALVIDLGTNGPMSGTQFDEIMAAAAGVPRVIFFNVRMPRSWEVTTNSTLSADVPTHPPATLIDWYDASAAAGVLGPDAIHPTPQGAQVYTNLLQAALAG